MNELMMSKQGFGVIWEQVKRSLNHLNTETKLPTYLYRKDDGERWTLCNGKYEMDRSMMHTPYRYSYAHLMNTGAFSEIPPEK